MRQIAQTTLPALVSHCLQSLGARHVCLPRHPADVCNVFLHRRAVLGRPRHPLCVTKLGLVDLGAFALMWSFRSPIDLALLAILGQQLLAAELLFVQHLPQPGIVSPTCLLI